MKKFTTCKFQTKTQSLKCKKSKQKTVTKNQVKLSISNVYMQIRKVKGCNFLAASNLLFDNLHKNRIKCLCCKLKTCHQ